MKHCQQDRKTNQPLSDCSQDNFMDWHAQMDLIFTSLSTKEIDLDVLFSMDQALYYIKSTFNPAGLRLSYHRMFWNYS